MTEMNDQYAARSGDSNVPVPDPTRLTTQLVDRALAGFREVVETRLGAMDRATKLVADGLEKMAIQTGLDHQRIWERHQESMFREREYIESVVSKVGAVADERFTAIATQFKERDTRTEQAAEESRISLDAALAAAKEAVSEQNKANALAIGKSEDATKERLDSLVTLMTSGLQSLADQIGDLKSRLDRIEAGGVARATGHTESRLNIGAVFGGVGLVISALAIAATIIIALTR